MAKFEKNNGTCHPHVAWVATIKEGDKLAEAYHGCGEVEVEVGTSGEVLAFRYKEPRMGAEEAPLPGNIVIEAMASCYQLIVLHGTAAAAVLNALGGKK